MSALAHIQRGRTLMPRRIMLYGVHGVGKSTFGAMAETPVFITTEEGTNDIDCAFWVVRDCVFSVRRTTVAGTWVAFQGCQQ